MLHSCVLLNKFSKIYSFVHIIESQGCFNRRDVRVRIMIDEYTLKKTYQAEGSYEEKVAMSWRYMSILVQICPCRFYRAARSVNFIFIARNHLNQTIAGPKLTLYPDFSSLLC